MNLNFPIEHLAKNEHDKWLSLCAALRKAGAVTQEDCESNAGARDTSGQKLFAEIRAWGDSVAALSDGRRQARTEGRK